MNMHGIHIHKWHGMHAARLWKKGFFALSILAFFVATLFQLLLVLL